MTDGSVYVTQITQMTKEDELRLPDVHEDGTRTFLLPTISKPQLQPIRRHSPRNQIYPSCQKTWTPFLFHHHQQQQQMMLARI